MLFQDTSFNGVYLISPDAFQDQRGEFRILWSKDYCKQLGLSKAFSLSAYSSNYKKGTLRGLHYQKSPYEQAKLIHCIQGKIYDVIVDLRKNSDTYLQWFSIILSNEQNQLLYVPEGFAHGFQALVNNTSIIYYISGEYHEQSESGLHWKSASLNINWPLHNPILSDKDQHWDKI